MTKKDIVKRIASETGLRENKTQVVVQKIFDYIKDALIAGEKVEFREFGIFELKVARKRKARNPNKPKNELIIPERVVAKFRPSMNLKKRVRKIKPKSIK